MKKIIDEFNSFFEGSAKAVIKDNSIEITIGSQTLIIEPPSVIGAQSKSTD